MKRPQRRTKVRQKKELAAAGVWPREDLARMAKAARYVSSEYHKAMPDGQSVPKHRPDKTVCPRPSDRRSSAFQLLKGGFRRGMVSGVQRDGWPRVVWAVADGVAYEAILSNQGSGEYHGYPMKARSHFTRHILMQWGQRA